MNEDANLLQEQNNKYIEKLLIHTCYSEAKLALIGFIFAIALHVYLMVTVPVEGILPYVLSLSSLVILFVFFAVFFEKKVKSTRILSFVLNTFLICGCSVMGVYLIYCLTQLPPGSLHQITFAISIGVMGGATLAFASSRAAFYCSSVPLAICFMYYAVVMEYSFNNLFTGGMILIYEIVLLVLAERDFSRRKQLIITQLNLKEEKKALAHSLHTVEKLKQQQDGDYFLTSLLLKPLGVNRSKNPRITIEFFIAQKKRFEFRGKEREIGGDICIAHDICLSNRDYTVFLNADAMGKSIKGAGGAIVIGSVFHAIIERTKNSREVSSKSPERWLKNTFLELRSVFESFDGSMLVSTVIGLIDVANGLLYYLNIEHPWNILYRNGKASFMEQSLSHHKLGMTIEEQEVNLMTFLMQPGDVILSGSDGRDDILIESQEKDRRVINHDEQQILQRIEESNAELEKAYDVLKSYGELTDDLSLLRIKFIGGTVEKEREDLDYSLVIEQLLHTITQEKTEFITPEISLLLSKCSEQTLIRVYNELYKQKEYLAASMLAEHLNNQSPLKTNYLYLASKCLQKAGKPERAAEMGERLLLRDPQDIKNTVHLAKLHMLLRNQKRLQELLSLTERYNLSDVDLDAAKQQLQELVHS
ncbi:MAG: PP2C family protein-serine/threonine phosphatase [Spirochaetota bacterium]